MYYDVYPYVKPNHETNTPNLYCPTTRPCDKDCKEYKCDRFWGEVINCKNCAARDNIWKCPFAKYYKTEDTDYCAWYVRKKK